MSSFLLKLAAEVEKNDRKGPDVKGDKSGAGDKKDGKGKGFPFKSSKENNGSGNSEPKNGNGPEKKDGKANPFGKKSEGESGKDQEGGQNSKGKNNNFNGPSGAPGEAPQEGNESGNGDEQEIPGNESAEGAAMPGTGAVDPVAVIDFFAQNPVPNDEAYHEFAEAQGYDVHQAEMIAYALAGKYVMFLRGGKSAGQDISQIDPEQLNMGMEVEAEHSDDPATRKKIALDHLIELPDYYTRLAAMEGAGGEVVAEPKQPGKEEENAQPQNEKS